MQKTVHIIGAGISGLSAAVRLANAGYKVAVHEATQQAGGRCRSYFDAATNLTIDNGNHLLLSGNRHALSYARSIGTEAGLVGPARAQFPFVDLASGRRWQLDLGDSRLPLWVFDEARRVPDTTLRDYLALAPLAWAGTAALVGNTIPCKGTLYDRLVQPLLLAALNVDPPEGSAGLAGAIVRETLLDVDVIGFCLPADQKIGPGDQFIAKDLAELQRVRKRPVVALVTKTDTVDRERLAEHLIEVDRLGEWAAIVPCSAVAGKQVDDVANVLLGYLPESPQLYPDDVLTDESDTVMIAELIREAALEGVRDELPHSLAVVVEEMVPREDRPADKPLMDVRVNIFVERPSQKAIIIGRGGSRLREVGTTAREGIEKLLGQRVYLDLHVKVAKDWQRDPKQLGKLGFNF